MTTKEFSNEFDIHYNSIASNQAPGLDLYEKSVFLTKAQLEIVKNYANGLGNKYQAGFENTSKRRADLKELIFSHASTTRIDNNANAVDPKSVFFLIPKDVFLIVQESAKLISTNSCINGTYANVVPKTHDEYNIQKDNPFKKPNKKIVWRLDFHTLNTGNSNVELLTSEQSISEYKVRYLKYPEPIILTNLDDAFSGEGLSIDGKTNEQTCKLSENIHREILDRAIEIALADYKPETLQVKLPLNQRNE
jgi:hypothetical protein